MQVLVLVRVQDLQPVLVQDLQPVLDLQPVQDLLALQSLHLLVGLVWLVAELLVLVFALQWFVPWLARWHDVPRGLRLALLWRVPPLHSVQRLFAAVWTG